MPKQPHPELIPIVRSIEALLEQVKRLAEGDSHKPENSPEVQAKIDRRECVSCGRIVPINEEYIRGLGPECYGTTMRRFRDGTWNESDKIAEGKIAVRATPGRNATVDREAVRAAEEARLDKLAAENEKHQSKQNAKRKKKKGE